ncbi:DNA-binding response regulator [Candidatus Kaiserbacteria bacterium CG10_big_fil_rev_8_21_14_0_10_59_10]|uniref:DNA-binding response regulator n=1 Tax=Candidatus Kaiserbacteria bacterium CG10_big_fil_rev_8_21_14_0_10_59_10 TaxID=1974612 RepID=A0A2H0U7E6_9BACT|nr:MAG: DNA-binding response regulator [Candidatus Kaiserbacteria bacterium CG10_big_fil_rev_8_21_14_0_10_59_10]
MKILLVEDEKKLADALAQGLEAKGYTVDVVSDGKKALNRISLHRTDYDLMILDLMLPSMDGDEICKTAREWGVTTPILILTARNETGKKVDLLLKGADDYLPKPFSFDELVARIHALMRRPNEIHPAILKVADIELDPAKRTVTRGGKELTLTLKEFGLLEYFMRHPNQVVNREDLLAHLWDFNYASFSNVVDVHIKNLRRKLDTGDGGRILETVRGIGYRLRDQV